MHVGMSSEKTLTLLSVLAPLAHSSFTCDRREREYTRHTLWWWVTHHIGTHHSNQGGWMPCFPASLGRQQWITHFHKDEIALLGMHSLNIVNQNLLNLIRIHSATSPEKNLHPSSPVRLNSFAHFSKMHICWLKKTEDILQFTPPPK